VCAAVAVLPVAQAAKPQGAFAARANRACGDYYRAVLALPRPTDLPSLATFMARAHPLAVRFAKRLRALDPPARQAALYRTFVSTVAASNALDPQIVDAAKRGDATRVRTLAARADELDKTLGVAASTLGLVTCANPPRA
jgi:hypothetical protein